MSNALIVIDMQNGFIHPDGSLPSLGMAMPGIESVVAENEAAIAAARCAGIPVIYTRSVFRPGMVDLPMRMGGFLPPEFELLERGSWDAEIHADLTPAEGEAVIDKNRYDAFLNTPPRAGPADDQGIEGPRHRNRDVDLRRIDGALRLHA